MRSLQTKFLAVNICAMAVLAVIVGGTGIFTTTRLLQKDAERMLTMTCEVQKVQLDLMFNTVEQAVRIMETQSLTEIESVERLSEDEAYRADYTAHMLKLFQNVASHTDGAVAYYLRYNPEIAPSTDGFFWSKEDGTDDFHPFPPTDILAYEPSDAEHVGWYYIPVENGGPTWLMPYENRNNNIFMISYVIPLYVEEQLVGVVGLDVDFHNVMKQVDSINVYETGYAYLLDDQSRIAYHKELSAGSERPAENRRMLEYSCELNNDMNLVITVDKFEIYHDRDSIAVEIIVLCAVIALIFIVITIILTRRLIKPLKELTAATQRMKEGDFHFAFDNRTNDEIGILSESFQHAAAHLKAHMNHMNGLAYYDALTGVKNATAYQEAVAKLETEIAQGNAEFAILILDVNGLKIVNDQYGHSAGDRLITAASALICDVFGHSPVYRIGGDEFAVILKHRDYVDRPELISRFDEELPRTTVDLEQGSIPLSVARGAAEFDPETDRSVSQVFHRADKRMYENKAAVKGGNL